jgi:hypothetical protein
MYGIAHCLIDRDGRVIGCNLPIGNAPLLEQAPAMAQILRELVADVPAEHLRYAAQVLVGIDAGGNANRARMTSSRRIKQLPTLCRACVIVRDQPIMKPRLLFGDVHRSLSIHSWR